MSPLSTLLASGDGSTRPLFSDRLHEAPTVEVVGECGTVTEAIDLVRSRPLHLLVLDTDLPDDGGRAVLEALGDEAPPTVVVGAKPGDGLWAFAFGAVDCLPAPFDAGRLDAALRRARDRVVTAEIRAHRDQLLALLDGGDSAPSPIESDAGRLVVRSGSQLIFLDPKDVDWIEACGVYVCLHVGGTKHLLRETLSHVEERLDGSRFIRIHRSTILNLDRVQKIVPHLNGGAVAVLKDGSQLKMSRTYRERIHASLG